MLLQMTRFHLCCDCMTKFHYICMCFPGSSVGKESTCHAGDPGLIPGWVRFPGEGIGYPLQYFWASLLAQMVNNLPTMWETWVQSLDWEDPLEEGMKLHYSILAWRVHMDRGTWWATWCCRESDTTEWWNTAHTHTHTHTITEFLFIHCRRALSLFHVLSTVSHTVMNIEVHVSFQIFFKINIKKWNSWIILFWEISILFSSEYTNSYSHQWYTTVPVLYIFSNMFYFLFMTIAILVNAKWYFLVLIWTSVIINGVEHLCMCLFKSLMSSW